jgi:hypothetical protein
MTRVLFVAFWMAAWSVTTGALSAQETKGASLQPGEFTTQLNGLKLWHKISGSGPVCLMPTPGWGPSSDLYFRTLQPLETPLFLERLGLGK